MINSIHIKGFRGIESGSITKFRQFNIFVGANNAGKSAVMEALYLASTVNQKIGLSSKQEESFDVENRVQVQNVNVLIQQEDLLQNSPLKLIAGKHGDLGDLLDKSRESEGIIIANLSELEPTSQRFEFIDLSKRKSLEENIALFGFDYPIQEQPENKELAKLIWGDVNSLPDNGRIAFCWYPDLTYDYKGSASWIIEGQLPAAEHTFLCDTSVVQSYIPVSFYRRVVKKIPGWSQRIARHFGSVFEIKDPFTVQFIPIEGNSEKIQGWIARDEDKPALSIDAFGDGARAAFKLLAPLVVMAEMVTPDAPGLLLWEEPEAFQNPKTLGKLLAEVVKIIRDKPIQVFIATHNLELVAYITQMLDSKNLDPDQTMVFQMNLSDGKLQTVWIDYEDLKTSLEFGLDPRGWKDFKPPFQFKLKEN